MKFSGKLIKIKILNTNNHVSQIHNIKNYIIKKPLTLLAYI